MNALDTALVKLAAATTALEYHAPALGDVKDAVDNAKAAAKILDAAYTLMSCGVYTVAESPAEAKFTDPAEHTIQMPEIPALRPYPQIILGFDDWAEEDAADEFNRRLEVLAENLDEHVFYLPWELAWEADHKDAFLRLLLAEEREPKTFALPTDDGLNAWLDQFEAPPEVSMDHMESFKAATPEEQETAFKELLSEYEDAGMEEGLKAKGFKTMRVVFESDFEKDREAAYNCLWHAYYTFPLDRWRTPNPEEISARLIFKSQLEPIANEEAPADIDPFSEEGGAK